MKLRVAPAIVLSLVALTVMSSSGQDGKSEQQSSEPPPSAIRYESHVSAGGVAPAGGTLSGPQKADKESARRGAALFGQMNCDGCHGGGALGWQGPSLADGRWRYGGADDEIFSSIYYGRPKGMPAYGGVLGADGVWTIVAYLTSLPVPDAVPTQSYESPPATSLTQTSVPTTGEPVGVAAASSRSSVDEQAGEALMTKYGCVACHAVGHKIVGPAFRDVAAKYRNNSDALVALSRKVTDGSVGVWGQIPMPANTVPEPAIHTLLMWVLSTK